MAESDQQNQAQVSIKQAGRITVENLTDLLVRNGLMSDEQRKDVVVKAPRQTARLRKEKKDSQFSARRSAMDIPVSATEVVASFKLETADGSGKPLEENLITESLAAELAMPFVKIDPLKLDMNLVTRTISRPFARKHTMVPIDLDEQGLVVAVDDPFDREGLDGIRRAAGKSIRLVLSTHADISRIINEFYGFRSSVTAAEKELKPSFDIGNLEQYVKMKPEAGFDAQDAPIISAVEYLLRYAYDQRASDIHIEPKREQSLVRFRIDGILHDIHKMPKVVHAAVVSRVKMLARMDIAEKRRPQDGRIKTEHKNREVELRVSTLPVAFGEKIVIRIFDPEVLMQELDEIGFFERERDLFDTFISNSNGMILVTGPTGSGKTTTLYSALRTLNSAQINITTIEDPIEMIYEDFNQISVQTKIDVTFSSALRTILRQDPDVIMVGEIRDKDTATHAIQAALTGHLVFSTLHTNDAASSVTRLLDLGIEPFLISSTLLGVVAQRLVRKICPHCKAETEIGPMELEALHIPVKDENQRVKVFYGEGCLECRGTGYLGRTGLFEVLDVSQRIRKLINKRADSSEVQKAGREDGMMLLREAAIKKLGMGVTTFDEVIRVTSM